MRLTLVLKTLAFAAALSMPACTLAQSSGETTTKAGALVAPSQVFDKILSATESDFVSAASAMPADKFDFAPSSSVGTFTGVRTFSSEVKHVTEANYGILRGFGLPNAKPRAEIEKLTDRDQILQALKDSFTYAHAAIAMLTPANAFLDLDGKGTTRAGQAAYISVHMNDHYGQMVEYLRMNGIIPPASRK